MGIPAGVVRIVLGGTAPGGEIWETGFWMTNTGVTDEATANALALIIYGTLSSADDSGAMRITVETFFTALSSWDYVRVYAYPNGGPVATAIGYKAVPQPLTGSGSHYLPNQVAVVLTTRTQLAGRRHRGRMYLPCFSSTLTAAGQLDPTILGAVCTAWATAFSDINHGTTGQVVVVSTAGSTSTQISLLTMDTRCDIQRKRADRQVISGRVQHDVTLN